MYKLTITRTFTVLYFDNPIKLAQYTYNLARLNIEYIIN